MPSSAPGPVVLEEPASGGPPRLRHPDWNVRLPWLIQGITTRGASGADPYDLALFGAARAADALARWRELREALGVDAAVHARQVHGAAVRVHDAVPPGLLLAPPCDGHVTGRPGLLLGVTVADCVPVWLVHPGRRIVAVLHAGWRGTAAGVLEAGIRVLGERFGIGPAGLLAHLGPAICGACYEVGPEVHEALGLPPPSGPEPVDLRAVLARRAEVAGVRPDAVTRSGRCTRCGDAGLFSHRGGDAGRQVAFAAVAP